MPSKEPLSARARSLARPSETWLPVQTGENVNQYKTADPKSNQLTFGTRESSWGNESVDVMLTSDSSSPTNTSFPKSSAQ